MPVDQNGNSSRPATPIPVSGQNADAPQVNVPVDDIYAILNRLVFLDGRKPLLGNQDFNGYRVTGAGDAVDDQDYVTKAQLDAALADIATIPTGVTLPLTSNTIPAGWLAVNGQTISRETYAGLWAHAQASGMLASSETDKPVGLFGPGNGATTFTLPNLYADGGYFIRPLASGRTIGSVQADELKSHTHGVNDPGHTHDYEGSSYQDRIVAGSESERGSTGTTRTTDPKTTGITIVAVGGTETRPKNVAYPVIIKA